MPLPALFARGVASGSALFLDRYKTPPTPPGCFTSISFHGTCVGSVSYRFHSTRLTYLHPILWLGARRSARAGTSDGHSFYFTTERKGLDLRSKGRALSGRAVRP